MYTTRTITSCGVPMTCPASGYALGGGGASQSGQIVITTTASGGHPITYTQIPLSTGGNGGQGGDSVVTTTLGNGNVVTYTQAPLGTGSGGSGGNGQGGRVVTVTTTVNGNAITYTQSSVSTVTGGGGGGGSSGTGTGTGTGTGGGSGGGDSSGNNGGHPGGTIPPLCPGSNGQTFTSAQGMQYDVECDVIFTDATLATQTQTSLGNCVSACDMFNLLTFTTASQCLGVSWLGEQTVDNCLLVRSVWVYALRCADTL